MERLVAVWCPSLLTEGERGDEVREFLRVIESVVALCPWVEPVRLGVCTLPARGPSRFFGGEPAVVDRLATATTETLGNPDAVSVGIADGLFAAMLAARTQVIVPKGGTAAFVAPWSVAVLQRPELAVTLQRLGVHTLGQFAALPTRHVLARFGSDVAACHRVARGEDGDLVGLRDAGVERRLRTARGDIAESSAQPGFFGGTSSADVRAAAAFTRVQRRLGTGAVLVGRLRGGRGPAERATLVPWGSREAAVGVAASAHPPWPGQLPSPSPVSVMGASVPAEIVDPDGQPVRVSGRGLLTGPPFHLSVNGAAWQRVGAWAGPWPVTERWWAVRRRRARMQVVTASGTAVLLAVERERWWLEAVYD